MISLATLLAFSSGSIADGTQDPQPGVHRRDVTFRSHDVELAGHLYLPADYDGSRQLPAVVVTGAWTTVKEQMPAVYARAMARRGFAALTFDFRGWGATGGAPRFLEHPERKTQDIVVAAAFLARRPEVDPARVAGLGVCASAGYMSDAVARSGDLRALALVAPWLHDAAIAETVYGGADGVAGLIATGRDAAASEQPKIIEAASTTNEGALMFQVPYYTEEDRGRIAAYDNQFNLASWEPWLTYDAISIADRLRKPTLAVHSQAAVIPQGITEFARRMGPWAEVVWLDGVSQFDFYDRPEPVTQAVAAVAAHLGKVFATQADVAAVTTVVEAVMNLVDLRQFETLETLYADRVFVDYEALSGQPAAEQAARELLASWASVLPGFDRTRHALHNVNVQVDGDAAAASADFTAEHFLGARFWKVWGSYRFELVREGANWRIRSHALQLGGESGSREVLAVAANKAAESPVPYLTQSATQAAVRTFLESLESKDMAAFAGVWADDAAQEMPFAPKGFPKEVRGRDAVVAHYAAWPQVSGDAEFTENLKFYAMRDPEWVFATFTGRVQIVPTGKLYEQTYGGLFHVVGGKIRLFREYFNPAPFVEAFDLKGEQKGLGR